MPLRNMSAMKILNLCQKWPTLSDNIFLLIAVGTFKIWIFHFLQYINTGIFVGDGASLDATGRKNPHSNFNKDELIIRNSLVAWWLGFWAFTAVAQVQSLFRELRFYTAKGAKKERKKERKKINYKSEVKVTQSCLTLCDPMDCYSPWNSLYQNTGMGSLSLLQGSSQPMDGVNPGLLCCRRILCQLSHKGSPNYKRELEK